MRYFFVAHGDYRCISGRNWVNRSIREGMRAGRVSPRGFLRAKLNANSEEQPCQPVENPVLPDSFTQIYIVFDFFTFQNSGGFESIGFVCKANKPISDAKLIILTLSSYHQFYGRNLVVLIVLL